jgi:cobalt/nickel transport system permease protein
MGFAHLDQYADRSSWLNRRTSPPQRLWIAIAAAFAAGLMPPGAWRATAALAAVVAFGAWAARVPAAVLARRVIRTFPFFLLPALALPFTIAGPPAFDLGPFTASWTGLLRAAEIVARATLAVSAVTIVISVTRATDLLGAMDRLPLPKLMRSSLALGYRYVYVLTDELERTTRALKSRMGEASRLRYWHARAVTLAHLFLRSHDRGTRIHAAMLSRGYRDRLPTLDHKVHTGAGWSLVILVVLALVWLGGYLEVRG